MKRKSKNNHGFISSLTVYSFFAIIILLMTAALLTYIYKTKLLANMAPNPKLKTNNICTGKTLSECLLMTYYVDNIGKTHGNLDDINLIKQTIKSDNDYYNKSGLFAAKDESNTTSYFYRGNIDNNYISFAGFTWRVLRINGTENVRIILDDVDDINVLDTLTSKNTASQKYYVGDLKLIECGNLYSYQKGSLITDYDSKEFKNTSNRNVCKLTNRKYDVGLMSGQKSSNKDERYGNLNNSDILNVLYDFYDKYLNEYSSYISTNDYFCANKNPLSDEDKKENNEFEEIVKSVCKKSGWEWACNNNFAKSLNYANFEQIYYGELMNIMKNINSNNDASYICENSGATASSQCNKAINLSTYSSNSQDKIKYDFSSNDLSGGVLQTITSPCGYTQNGKTTYRDNFLQELSDKGKITYKDKEKYNSIIGNGSLSRPIGLISATEAYLSGVGFSSFNKSSNQQEQEYTSSISSEKFKNYWTSSAALSDFLENNIQQDKIFGYEQGLFYNDVISPGGNYYFAVNSNNNLRFTVGFYLTAYGPNDTPYARPVINLKSNVKYCSGDGTKNNPYKITTSNAKCINN